ncbi:MAG: hypothetical protein HZA52_01640 [Planctomycetes bacterium]|nr:hypothetical protein [Planctomycetota bacterium]
MSNHQAAAPSSGHAAAVAAGYEKEDPKVKPILIFTILLVLANVATFYAMIWTNNAFTAAEASKDVVAHPLAVVAEPPAPRLQAVPSAEWNAFKTEQQTAIGVYRWLDRTNGVVQIPVERALEIVSERGLPHRK